MANPDLERKRTITEQPFNYNALENPADDFVLDKPTICRAYVDNVRVQDWVANSEQEAYDLYRNYAHKIGFSIRKEHHSFYPNSRKIKDKDFVCSKAGVKKEPKPGAKLRYQKSTCRSDCKAMVRFSVDLDGVWKVKKFVECHNHEFAEMEDQHLLRSSRCIDNDRGSILKSMTHAGIRPVDAFNYLAEEVGGVENVGFLKRDAYNYIQKEHRNMIEYGDTTTLIELFKERQSADNMFAWDAQWDENDRLANFFWVDGGGRLDYDCYGDVLIFDTSYRLNKYNLACAPIVGVNNHWQNVLLGVAFLSDETIDSFTWFFKSFLRVMGGKHPITIFTDQDQAMARAIEVALPNTRHRLCQWHISKKAPSKVPCFNSNKHLRGLFYTCLSKCDSEKEFDEAWAKMLTEGNLQGHTWLEDLYRIRHKWSTAFNKNIFSMGILSTQRSESTNNICHGISKPTSTLTDCFLGLERLAATWRRNERDEDHHNSQSEIIPVVKGNSMLKQAAKFYSRKIYKFFEFEFLQGVGVMTLQNFSINGDVYIVKSQDCTDENKEWIVHFKSVESIIECSCRKFEIMGLLCSHCIKVLSQNNVFLIPDQYLLSRWSKTAKKDYYTQKKTSNVSLGDGLPNRGPGMIFRNHTCRMMYEISTIAKDVDGAEELVLNALHKLYDEVENLAIGKPADSGKKVASKKQKPNTFKDPAKVRPKGVSNARLKSYFERPKRKKGNATDPAKQKNLNVGDAAGVHSSLPDCFREEHYYPKSNQSNERTTEDSGFKYDDSIWKFNCGFNTQ